MRAEEVQQAEDSPEAIFARAITRGLATDATVETMRASIDKGEWSEEHYAVIWCDAYRLPCSFLPLQAFAVVDKLLVCTAGGSV